jgi:hypothetical protein
VTAVNVPEVLARERADKIRHHLEIAAAGLQVAAGLAAKAYRARDWETLGYESWAAYCTGEFALARLKWPAGDREPVIAAFAAAGLSSRAVAAALGTSQSTAARELRTARTAQTARRRPGESDDSPAPPLARVSEPPPVQGLDGRAYPVRDVQPPQPDAGRQVPIRVVEPPPPPRRPDVGRQVLATHQLRDVLPLLRRLRAEDVDDKLAQLLDEAAAEITRLRTGQRQGGAA